MQWRRILPWILAALVLAGRAGNENVSAGESAPPANTAACSRPLTHLAEVPAQYPQTLTGLNSSQVTVTQGDRVVTTTTGAADIVYSLGAASRLVAMDLASDFPGASVLPTANPQHEIAVESILALKPDLVIASSDPADEPSLTSLRDAGVTVVVVPDAASIDGIGARVNAIGTALGIPQRARLLAEDIQARVASVAATNVGSPVVAFLYLRGAAGVYLMGGRGSGADDLIARAGGVDMGTSLGVQKFAPLTAEAIATADPDVILVMSKGLDSVGGADRLLSMPGIAGTKAAAHRAIVSVDDTRLLSFGPATPDVIACISEQLKALHD